MHIHVPFIMYYLRLFVVVFQEILFTNVTLFVGSQSFISLPCFLFVSALVSEIRKLNKEEKKNSEIMAISVSTPFLGV